MSRLHLVNHANKLFPLINDNNITGQQIEVFDTDTGKLRALGSASPANGFGENYALAPDGSRFATLNNQDRGIQPSTSNTSVGPFRQGARRYKVNSLAIVALCVIPFPITEVPYL